MSEPQSYIVQSSTPPVPVPEGWSRRDYQGSWLLLLLSQAGAIVGVLVAAVGVLWAVLGGVYTAKSDWAAMAAANALVGCTGALALFLWPYFRQRRNFAALFSFVIGILACAWTIFWGGQYLVYKSGQPPASVATMATQAIAKELRQMAVSRDQKRIACRRRYGFSDFLTCMWPSWGDDQERMAALDDELYLRDHGGHGRSEQYVVSPTDAATAYGVAALVVLSGVALLWGSAEARKVMWSEPGAGPVVPRPVVAVAPPPPNGDQTTSAFNSWCRDYIMRDGGVEGVIDAGLALAHYQSYCRSRKWPEAGNFGERMNAPDGPIVANGGFVHAANSRTLYKGIKLRPDEFTKRIQDQWATP